MTPEEVNKEMEKVFPEFRERWCESKSCWCMGCVNVSARANITKQEWLEWLERQKNPAPTAGRSEE